MSWLGRLDARAAGWPVFLSLPYRCTKWLLVVLGFAMLTYNYALKWNWPTAITLLALPLGLGILEGVITGRASRGSLPSR